MESNVHQTLERLSLHFGHTGNRLWIQHAVTENPQTAGTLRDQDGAIRQERHTPRVREVLRQNDDADLVLFAGVENVWSIAQRRHGYAGPCCLSLGLLRKRCSADDDCRQNKPTCHKVAPLIRHILLLANCRGAFSYAHNREKTTPCGPQLIDPSFVTGHWRIMPDSSRASDELSEPYCRGSSMI